MDRFEQLMRQLNDSAVAPAARLRVWAQLREEFPDHPAGYLGGGVELREAGELAEAEALIIEAVLRFPLLAVAGLEHANLAFVAGDPDLAATRRQEQHQRLRAAAELSRQANNAILRAASLEQLARYFPDDVAAAVEYAALAEDAEERYRRWNAIPRGSDNADYYLMAWELAFGAARDGRDIAAPLLDALLDEPFAAAGRAAPVYLKPWFLEDETGSAAAARFRERMAAHLAEGRPLSPGGELAVLCLQLDLPGVDPLTLLARHALDDSAERINLIFGARRNLLLAPGLAEMLIQAGALDRVSPAALYNLAVVLKCADAAQYQRWLAAAVESNPVEERPSEALGILGNAHRSRRVLCRVPARKERLKIALCISGQLREFRRAMPTWESLGLHRHDVDTFVHTWAAVGRKLPVPMHASRIFRPRFADVYQQAWVRWGGDMGARFPGLLNFFFADADLVGEDTVRDFFGARQVVVEDDRYGDFVGWGTPMKMYYKVQSAWMLAANSGERYDLVIRSRADLGMNPRETVDWERIHHRAHAERMLFTGGGPDFLTPVMGHKIGDLFAIGSPECMEKYSTAHAGAYQALANGYYACPQVIGGHINFAYQTMVHGILTEDIGVPLGLSLVDCVLEGALLEEVLLRDMGGAPRDDLDAAMLEACRADAA